MLARGGQTKVVLGGQYTSFTPNNPPPEALQAGLDALLTQGPLAPTQSVGNWSANSCDEAYAFARDSEVRRKRRARGTVAHESGTTRPLTH